MLAWSECISGSTKQSGNTNTVYWQRKKLLYCATSSILDFRILNYPQILLNYPQIVVDSYSVFFKVLQNPVRFFSALRAEIQLDFPVRIFGASRRIPVRFSS